MNLPINNPVLIFTLILFIILFVPILLNKLKIPYLIGLIVAGALIGPNGFNLMLRDSSIILFGTVGLLYIMFLAGLEMDMNEFKKSAGRSIVFGALTFIIPMTLGILLGYYVLKFHLYSSILLASLFASHTLIAYPIISKLGITKNKAVNTTLGGTIITDTLALLVLAVIVGMSTGEVNDEFWVKLIISLLIFGSVVLIGFPILGKWFFKKFDDNISQYIFVLGLVFLSAFLSEIAGVEAIIGAFLAGLALNRLISKTSPLMNRIHFVGNALFIPFFLIGVGMLIDYRVFTKGYESIVVAILMTLVATTAKYIASFFTQKIYRFSIDERRVIFGLSNAQAAATLAAVLVGYNVILGYTPEGEPIRLLNDSVLNGSIVMIFVTCIIATMSAQKGGQAIALSESSIDSETIKTDEERILIPISNPETINELVNLSLAIKSKSNTNGLYTLTIINNASADENEEKNARKILMNATSMASAADTIFNELIRYDINVVNGISGVVREYKISDLILGLHHKKGITDTFLGTLTEGILSKANTTTYIYKSVQPLSTINRHLVFVPSFAEKEIGFNNWLEKIVNISINSAAQLVFYGNSNSFELIKKYLQKRSIIAEFKNFSEWNDFLVLTKEIQKDDCLIFILSRKDRISYDSYMSKLPNYLNKYFTDNSFILVYPIQLIDIKEIDSEIPVL